VSEFSFAREYGSVRLPKATDGADGLRRGQLGAIHSLAGHFALRNTPAIVVMPTGSGKTAVLMMLPFFEAARRVLVVTPSQLVRSQITEEFKSMATLRRLGVLPPDGPSPAVVELKKQVLTAAGWDDLRDAEVVVTTPNTISPVLEGIAPPPPEMFDLLLIDEAHHSPARTWAAVLDAFPAAKRALFTATPYRRDRKFIKGDLVFNYPLGEARSDKVFGDITFEPVEPGRGEDGDIAIAKRVEAALAEDQAAGFAHSVMVRAETRSRADELAEKYAASTGLRLTIVHSGHTARHIKSTIKKLKARELDGVICVNMMGEGFDFPNLKIAGLHAPHRSLAVTLQFIGRFARVGDATIGGARFYAVPAEIEGETAKLFEDGAVWGDLVVNLAEARVTAESEARARIAAIEPASLADEALEDLSLHSLRPSQHVKVYQVPADVTVDITALTELPKPFETVYRRTDANESVAIFIGREQQKPPWGDQIQLGRSEYELVIVYYNRDANLLFINSSRRADSLYRQIGHQYLDRPPKILPLYKINRCLAGLTNIECFSVGMKNRLHTSHAESYRIIAGRNAHSAIRRSDGRLFHRGHIFCCAEENGSPVTLGYSSGSKLWSTNKGKITALLDWCRGLARKIETTTEAVGAPGLDILSVGEPLQALPRNVLAADWDSVVYEDSITLSPPNGGAAVPLTDTSIIVDRAGSTATSLRVAVEYNDQRWCLDCTPAGRSFFTEVPVGGALPQVTYAGDEMSLTTFLNEYPLHFYFADFSRLRGEEWFPCREAPDLFDPTQIQSLPWDNVDIEREFYKPDDLRDGRLSVQEYLEQHLLSDAANNLIFYDHRSGEVADYLVVNNDPQRVLISLYHCKGSAGPQPGARIEDVYEVACQVVKSFNLVANEKDLLKHVRRRALSGSRFPRGDFQTLQTLMRERGPRPVEYCLTIVQPGISRASLNQDGASIIGAADEFVRSLGALPLVVMGSE
jgi:hypothetical protein